MNLLVSRRLFILRHAERVDFTFTSEWISRCFDEAGNYTPKDLNMPETVPPRSQGPSSYLYDTPLTKIGMCQAVLTGQAFKKEQFDVTHVYCSPALRCIQTCDAFLKGCDKKNEVKIRVEPALFEFLGWYEGRIPTWMTPEELASAGYNIDLDYTPFMSVDKLHELKENKINQFYSRSASLTKNVCDTHENGNILFVGHSSTLEVCSRDLIGKKPREYEDLFRVLGKTPYCGIVEVDEEEKKWVLKGSPFPSLTHTNNESFDFSIMFD